MILQGRCHRVRLVRPVMLQSYIDSLEQHTMATMVMLGCCNFHACLEFVAADLI